MAKAKEAGKNKDKQSGPSREKIISDVHKMGEEIKAMIEQAKKTYAKADPKTKQAVIAGVAGAAALIAGVIGYKKMKRK